MKNTQKEIHRLLDRTLEYLNDIAGNFPSCRIMDNLVMDICDELGATLEETDCDVLIYQHKYFESQKNQ